ncbi:protein Transporter, Pam16 [Actinidia rufa]|uniref:Protein Transporter, Pam16 n=1 Tax=Actinidia rufa TaxID=165716 RepID=A0A7J0E5E7_9ERIC|nr:protein Transporter, Pam16 [Actinidia rufa]
MVHCEGANAFTIVGRRESRIHIHFDHTTWRFLPGYTVSRKWEGHASKSGVAQETIQNATRRASKVMTEQEARQILGVTEKSTWEEIVQASVSYKDLSFVKRSSLIGLSSGVLNGFLQPVQKYDNLFERNAKNGSFYLQSKVHRAKECLELLHQPKDQGTAT